MKTPALPTSKAPGLYHGAAPNGFGPTSPLKMAAFAHILQPRKGQSGSLIPAPATPPSTPHY